MTMDDLTQREHAMRIAEVLDVGSHGPSAMNKAKFVQRHAKYNPKWERAYWFLRCEVWFLEPWHALKRVIGLLESLADSWTPRIDDDDQSLLRWLYAEAVGVFSLNAALFAGYRLTWADDRAWIEWATDRLTEGAIPMHQMKVVSDAADKYIAGLLSNLRIPHDILTEAMGTFLPIEPEWTESLLALIERLAASPAITRELPRHVDLVAHERLVHRKHVDPTVLARIDRNIGGELDTMRRQVSAFLRGNTRLPEIVDKALSATTDGR